MPALKEADKGKTLTIEGDKTIKVDGEIRSVQWPGEAPQPVTNAKIINVFDRFVNVRPAGATFALKSIDTPWLASSRETQTVDLAFATVENSTDSEEMLSRFYMPLAQTEGRHHQETKLMDAREVTFGDLSFSHFEGAMRN